MSETAAVGRSKKVSFGKATVNYDPWYGKVCKTPVCISGRCVGFIVERLDDTVDRPHTDLANGKRVSLHLDTWEISIYGRYVGNVPEYHASIGSAMDAARAELGAN